MTIVKKKYTVNALKYDGTIHRSWQAQVIGQTSDLIELVGTFDKEVVHTRIGVIKRATVSYEFFWLDRWYNIFRFHEPDGSLRNFYCNIGFPPRIDSDSVSYVDLDIDILVWKDYSFEILDMEEFESNSLLFNYPKNVIEKCLHTIQELKSMIINRQMPFDYVEEEH